MILLSHCDHFLKTEVFHCSRILSHFPPVATITANSKEVKEEANISGRSIMLSLSLSLLIHTPGPTYLEPVSPPATYLTQDSDD